MSGLRLLTRVIGALILVLGSAYLYSKYVWFYRDPIRTPERTGCTIISPADGQVVYIKPLGEEGIFSEKLGRTIRLDELSSLPLKDRGEGWIIGIYMSPFDVHYNYSPIAGTIEKIAYTPAKVNVPMVDIFEYVRIAFLRRAMDNFAAKFHFVNERNSILIKGEEFNAAIVEIADKYVNKISCFAKEGQHINIAEKVGFIDRGSQVDLIVFKKDIDIKVEFGQQVYAGKTVIAEY